MKRGGEEHLFLKLKEGREGKRERRERVGESVQLTEAASDTDAC